MSIYVIKLSNKLLNDDAVYLSNILKYQKCLFVNPYIIVQKVKKAVLRLVIQMVWVETKALQTWLNLKGFASSF